MVSPIAKIYILTALSAPASQAFRKKASREGHEESTVNAGTKQLSDRARISTAVDTDRRLEETLYWKGVFNTSGWWWTEPRTCAGYNAVDLADDDERKLGVNDRVKKDCECVAPFELVCDVERTSTIMEQRSEKRALMHGQRAFSSMVSNPSQCQCRLPELRCASIMPGLGPESLEPCLLYWGDRERSWFLMVENVSYPALRLEEEDCQEVNASICPYVSLPEDDPDRSEEEGHRGEQGHLGPIEIRSVTFSYDDCFVWASDYCILPGYHFGYAPTSIRRKWQSFGCYTWPRERNGEPCACEWGCKCESMKEMRHIQVNDDWVEWGSASEREKAWWREVGCYS